MAVFTPSPLMGEGWGEGGEVGTSLCFGKGCPSPQRLAPLASLSPQGARGLDPGFA